MGVGRLSASTCVQSGNLFKEIYLVSTLILSKVIAISISFFVHQLKCVNKEFLLKIDRTELLISKLSSITKPTRLNNEHPTHLIVDKSPLLQECVHSHDSAHVACQVSASGRARDIFSGVESVRVNHKVAVRQVYLW